MPLSLSSPEIFHLITAISHRRQHHSGQLLFLSSGLRRSALGFVLCHTTQGTQLSLTGTLPAIPYCTVIALPTAWAPGEGMKSRGAKETYKEVSKNVSRKGRNCWMYRGRVQSSQWEAVGDPAPAISPKFSAFGMRKREMGRSDPPEHAMISAITCSTASSHILARFLAFPQPASHQQNPC